VRALASKLRAGDVVNIVTWSTSQNVVLANHVAIGPNDSAVVAAAQQLSAGGATDLHAGLVAGYELAMSSFDVTRLNRLILMSDGVANVGETSAALIAEHAEIGDDEGIYLVGIGTGPVVAYNDRMMDLVTDAGRGAYLYLDTPEEAEHLLARRFHEVLEVAARAVRLELTVPWYFQMRKFYGEHYSENPSEVKPQHLAPGDAMVLLQTLKACDPSLISSADPVSLVATWNTPITHEIESLSLETTVGDLLAAPAPRMPKGKAIAAFTEALRSGQSRDLSRALDLVEAAQAGDDADLHQIEKLIRSHPSFGN